MIRRERGSMAFLALLAAMAVAVPVCSLLVPLDAPVHLSTFGLTLVGKYLWVDQENLYFAPLAAAPAIP
jgi:hypothetical protein